MLSPRAGEGAVEIGTDRPGRPCVRETVATAALGDEERLPLPDVSSLGDTGLLVPAAGRERGDSQQEQSRGEEAHQARRVAGSRFRPARVPRYASDRS